MVEEGQRVGEVGGHRPVGHPGRVAGEREGRLPDDVLVELAAVDRRAAGVAERLADRAGCGAQVIGRARPGR